MRNTNDVGIFFGTCTNPIINNPMICSVFTTTTTEGGNAPPPSSQFIITQNGLNIITSTGEKFITRN